ncbi:unnamed protein product, partial [Brassica rapa subsp. trilocularis]
MLVISVTNSRSTNHLKDKQCVDLTNKLTLQYNARLRDLLLVELKDKSKRRILRLRQRLSWTSLSTTKNMDGERGVLWDWDGREIGGDIAMWTNVVSLQGPVKACSFGTRTS